MRQATSRVIMIHPKNFGFNPETADSNVFQSSKGGLVADEISRRAIEEFIDVRDLLRAHGVEVQVIEDTDTPVKTDAVFPNNWFSTHEDGVLITYPMFSANRRAERNEQILEAIESQNKVLRKYSFEQYENDGLFLEGTGSLVLDRMHKVAYASLSNRTNIEILHKWCVLRGFDKVTFRAEFRGKPVYHTNVVMTIGTTFAMVCDEAIPDSAERQAVIDGIAATDREICHISPDQMGAFAGNSLQLSSADGESLLIMSDRARRSLSDTQSEVLKNHATIIAVPVNTIEKYGGGSVRCMIAENFLEARAR